MMESVHCLIRDDVDDGSELGALLLCDKRRGLGSGVGTILESGRSSLEWSDGGECMALTV